MSLLQKQALAQIALVSTSAEPLTAFDSARDAASLGAKLVLYPEWGFLPGAYELTDANRAKWGLLASELNIYVLLGVRYKGRNTIFVFFS
jgi:hypothetical protein